MKIEKINDKQIRCTISRADLEDRHIKFSELAFGAGKTKELFQDMMRQANEDFGFEVNDKPLMVEAIPVSPENIVLLITKVEDGDDRGSSLAKLFSSNKEEDAFDPFDDINPEELDNIVSSVKDEVSDNSGDSDLLYNISIYDNLSDVITVTKLIMPYFKGDSSVYKSPYNNKYYLSICLESTEPSVLNKILGFITEHGQIESATYAKDLFYLEHFEEILDEKAVEKLSAL